MSQSKSPLSKKEIHPLIHGPFSSCTYKYMYTYYQRIHHFYDRLDLRYHHSNHIKYSPKPAGVAPRFPMACDKTRKEATTIPRVCNLVGKEWLVENPTCETCAMALMFGGSSSINMYHRIDEPKETPKERARVDRDSGSFCSPCIGNATVLGFLALFPHTSRLFCSLREESFQLLLCLVDPGMLVTILAYII